MATFLIPDQSTFRMTIFMRSSGQEGLMSRHYRFQASTTGQQTSSALADDAMVTHGLRTQLLASAATGVKVEGASYRLDPNPLQAATDYRVGLAGTCAGGAGLLPTQSAGLLTYQSPLAGHKGQGRNYVPFPSVLYMTADGNVDPLQQIVWTGLASLLTGPIPCTTQLGGSGHLQACLIPPLPAGDTGIFYNGRASGSWATQRRRGSYGKLNKSPFGNP